MKFLGMFWSPPKKHSVVKRRMLKFSKMQVAKLKALVAARMKEQGHEDGYIENFGETKI